MEEFDEEVVGTPAETIGGADDPHVELRDIVLDVSTNLMSAEPDEFETKLRWGLESVARGVGADRGYVFQNCEGVFECVAEWTADGDARERRRFDPEEFGWLFDRLERFENVVVPRTDELPAGATLRTALRSAGVGAAVIVPVVDSWSLEGFAGVGVRGGDRQWDETEVSLLRTVGDMVGYSLARVRREQALEEQNERLETFASVLSHDLRNPLNVVTGNLALAEHDDEHVDRAAAAADRMEVLVDDVLTLVKQGQTIGETEQVSLAAVAERAWANVETPAADLDLDREALGTVEADPDRLQEACANLFRNAVEHGGADVRVEVGALDGDEGFYVADDGPGIPEAARETVFEHGYTTDDGTGLGLAIVESVVGAHGWTVSARESERGGARFDIRYRGDGVG